MLGAYRQHEPATQPQGGSTALGLYLRELHLLPQQPPPSKFKKGQHVQINLEPKAKYWVVNDLRWDEGRGWLYVLSDDQDDRTLPDCLESELHGSLD